MPPRLKEFTEKHIRLIALVVLALATGLGLYGLLTSDWRSAIAFWAHKWPVLGMAYGLSLCDLFLDSLIWTLLLRDFGVRPPVVARTLVYMSGYAGLFMPFQSGRLLRSDGLVRLGYAPFGQAARGEAALLFVSLVAAAAALSGAFTFLAFPLVAPLVSLLVIAVALLMADRVFVLLSSTPVNMPPGYWRRPRTFFLACLGMGGWLLNGTILFLVVRDLSPGITLNQTLLIGPANQLLGQATGLPGGIGAVEGLLGLSLKFVQVPSDHLVLAVAAFRLITFWTWLGVGWLVFLALRRWRAKLSRPVPRETADAR